MNPFASVLDRKAGRRLEPAVERARDALTDVPEAAERAQERLTAEGRDAVERLAEVVEEYVDDHEDVARWGPRIGFAAIGLVVGIVLGWFLASRSRDDEEDEVAYPGTPETSNASFPRDTATARH